MGAGAHSFVDGKRWRNTNRIEDFLLGINHNTKSDDFVHGAVKDVSRLERSDIIKETMMMGLRLTRDYGWT